MDKKIFVNMILSKLCIYRSKMSEKKKISDERRVNLYSKIDLTESQKEAIDKFYLKNYGRKVPHKWHRLYQSFTGKFDEKYFPELLYIPDFERKMNPNSFATVFEDKTMIDFITFNTSIKTPEIIISAVRGVVRDSKYNLISYDQQFEIAKKLEGEFFIKPATDSSSGKGCRIIRLKRGVDILTEERIESIIISYSGNYILQEKIKNSELLCKLYDKSINTFRVMTYVWDNRIYHCPVILRIGQGGSFVDNAHAGGMFIGVKDDGTLNDTAYTEFQKKYKKHPDSGIEFKNYKIPQIEIIIKSAKNLHSRIPQLGIISWDFTLNENNIPTLIEMNIRGGSCWLPQMAHGCGLFGENTADILKFIARKEVVSKEII